MASKWGVRTSYSEPTVTSDAAQRLPMLSDLDAARGLQNNGALQGVLSA